MIGKNDSIHHSIKIDLKRAMYSISTQTFVIYTVDKTCIDLQHIYDQTNINDNVVMVKFRQNVKYHPDHKVVKVAARSTRNFLDCVTITLINGKKRLGIKLFNNGSMQITGCKTNEHVFRCVNIIHPTGSSFRYYLIPVMLNVNLSLGFEIDRFKLAEQLHNDYLVNVPIFTVLPLLKFKLVDDMSAVKYDVIEMTETGLHTTVDSISHVDFFSKFNKKKLNKNCLTSISVFRNGKVLISGVNRSTIEQRIHWFLDIIRTIRDTIEIVPKQLVSFNM